MQSFIINEVSAMKLRALANIMRWLDDITET